MKKIFLLLLVSAFSFADIHSIGYWKKISGSVLLNLVDRTPFELTPGTLAKCEIKPIDTKLVFSSCDVSEGGVKFSDRTGKVVSEGTIKRLVLQEGVIDGRAYHTWTWLGSWNDGKITSDFRLVLSAWQPDLTDFAGHFALTKFPELYQSLAGTGEK